MAKKKKLEGLKFGRLKVVEEVIPKIHNYVEYKCVCDCGKKVIVKAGCLTGGRATSCGCFQRENASKIHKKNYDVKSKEYKTWCGIKRRCTNKNEKSYLKYGGRGISICDEWINSFENFLKDMGECPKNCDSIDRIDNSKGYFKENCRWSNSIEQANNRSTNIFVTYNGYTDTLANMCRKYNKPYKLVWRRLKSGLDIKNLIELPVQKSTRSLSLLIKSDGTRINSTL